MAWNDTAQVQAAREHAAGQVRGQALIAAAHEDQNLRSGPDPAVKGSGTLTKFRPVGGWPGGVPAGGEGTGSVKGANLVGAMEPTAFNAGAGAPAPTQVIRGMHQTFATDTGAGQPQEFATPLQAGQASNRFEKGKNLVAIENLPPEAQPGAREAVEGKFGGYRAPGQTLAEIAAAKEPPQKGAYFQSLIDEGVRKAKNEQEALHTTNFQKLFHAQYGEFDKAGQYVKPTDPAVVRDMKLAEEVARNQGPEAGMKHYQESLQVRQHEPLFNDMVLQQNKLPFTMQELGTLKQQNPELYRRTILTIGPKLGQAVKSQPQSPGLLGPTQLQGEPGAPQPGATLAPTAPPVRPTQPPATGRSLIESME